MINIKWYLSRGCRSDKGLCCYLINLNSVRRLTLEWLPTCDVWLPKQTSRLAASTKTLLSRKTIGITNSPLVLIQCFAGLNKEQPGDKYFLFNIIGNIPGQNPSGITSIAEPYILYTIECRLFISMTDGRIWAWRVSGTYYADCNMLKRDKWEGLTS